VDTAALQKMISSLQSKRNQLMNDEDKVKQLIADLQVLCDYCHKILAEDNITPDTFYPRKAYVYSVFMFCLSYTDGILALAERGQAWSIVPSVRGMQEAWINTIFTYTGDSQVWLYYMILKDELQLMKKCKELVALGLSDASRSKLRDDEAAIIIGRIKKQYKELPLVPSVITAKDQRLERRLTLKEECQIIDYYHSLKPSASKKKHITMVEHYEMVYGHFSGIAHVKPSALNGLYRRRPDGKMYIDIKGDGDKGFVAALLVNAYLYQYQLMKVYIANISTTKRKIPDNIKLTRRRVTSAKSRSN
jgi:hypothetical protein